MTTNVATSRVRVEQNTSEEINRRNHDAMLKRLEYFKANTNLIGDRMRQLDQEWDIERIVQINAPVISLASLFLGGIFRFLAYLVLGFLLQHAIQGWCPPVPILRNLGVRTQSEINEERMALKAIRGDLNEFLKSTSSAAPTTQT